MKKNNLNESQGLKADAQTIKKEDIKKLQKTFNHIFGANSVEMKKQSLKLRKKIYFYGFGATVFFVLMLYITKRLSFVGL